MNMEPKAIVIVYSGSEADSVVLGNIVGVLLNKNVISKVEDVAISTLDQSDIVKNVVKGISTKKTDKVEQAVIFITRYFDDCINKRVEFIVSLTTALQSRQTPEQLRTACEIIGNTKVFDEEMLERHKVSIFTVNIIKKVYKKFVRETC